MTATNPELLGPAPPGPSTQSRYRSALMSPRGIAGVAILGTVILLGLLAPVLSSFGPEVQTRLADLQGPSSTHLLGTDELGRDLWSRNLYGIRVDLVVAAIGVPLGAITGAVLGVAGAAWRRASDTVVQRLFDVLLAFPALILAVTVAAIVAPGKEAITVTIVLANIPIFGRIARDAYRTQSVREYITAARVLGVPRRRLVARHVFPNISDALIVQLALSVSLAVFLEAGMSFLGIGVQLPAPSLGNILSGALPYLSSNLNYAIGPIVAISGLVIGYNLVADALNSAVLRAR